MLTLAVANHYKDRLYTLQVFKLSYIIYTLYIHIYAVAYLEKVVGMENINLIRQSGLVEAAFTCFNLRFCLLFNIPLYCHNIDKPDKQKG